MIQSHQDITIAIAWCLAWGNKETPQHDPSLLRKFRHDLKQGQAIDSELSHYLDQAQKLQKLEKSAQIPDTIEQFQTEYDELWNESTEIGLVFGGATKIKQYVFETSNLQDIRGASALLDRINLIDLRSFFDSLIESTVQSWFKQEYPELSKALIPELIVYSTGGNILALCPAAYVHQLANAIEQCYTRETLIANSCAVGETFKLLEFRFGKIQQPWLQDYLANPKHELFQAYFGQPNAEDPDQPFRDRKSFNELVAHLASQFNQRRSGNITSNRPTRAYPPLYETHPYAQRDEGDRRSAIARVPALRRMKFSEPSGRKYIMGQIAKWSTEQDWWSSIVGNWKHGKIDSWVQKFLDSRSKLPYQNYFESMPHDTKEARSLREIGAASKPSGFVAYIYADGNNMGGYIQKEIKTPQDYRAFSQDISAVTEQAVYHAIAKHLKPFYYEPDDSSDRKDPSWIHPFEIVTIGGDDVFLIVPADRALAIANTLSQEFEKLLKDKQIYKSDESYNQESVHRYQPSDATKRPNSREQCKLSMSVGVLITAEDTPIYYAADLVEQLLKSAKQKAKKLKGKGYLGGTIDFLVMKSVTMISSNIKEFRAQGLTRERDGQAHLKLYGAPYTLHEMSGLLETLAAFKKADFPKSQLYQIRSLLEQGKQTAILNYRYFRARLGEKGQNLEQAFEQPWCSAKLNSGNLAPWMSILDSDSTTYETIWYELTDLFPFVPDPPKSKIQRKSSPAQSRSK
ncbi:type III-B CRISPR-associated protein Cas10/Cmr2 [Phormidesmis sp. 146-35]